jgi:hypothetical protein
MTNPAFLIHGANILYTLEKAGYNLDQFVAFLGQAAGC